MVNGHERLWIVEHVSTIYWFVYCIAQNVLMANPRAVNFILDAMKVVCITCMGWVLSSQYDVCQNKPFAGYVV